MGFELWTSGKKELAKPLLKSMVAPLPFVVRVLRQCEKLVKWRN